MAAMMLLPFLACLILIVMHTYLGQHVIERNVIFIDLALAQMAALGGIIALVLGFRELDIASYLISLLSAFFGAWLITYFNSKNKKKSISSEVFIGIIYVLATALTVLLISKSTVEIEVIKQMLEGNILIVSGKEVIHILILYSLVGFFHFLFRKKVWAVTKSYHQDKIANPWWDLFFYLTFAIVVTSSVKLVGVLLVFSFLIIPAAVSFMFTKNRNNRLFIGIGIGIISCMIGLFFSAIFDFPTGPAIVCVFGGIFFISFIIKNILAFG